MPDGQAPAQGMLRAFTLSLLDPYKAQVLPSRTMIPCSAPVACSSVAVTSLSIVKRPAVSRDAVAIPPTASTMQLTALVEHILVQKEGHLSELIAEELNISPVGP